MAPRRGFWLLAVLCLVLTACTATKSAGPLASSGLPPGSPRGAGAASPGASSAAAQPTSTPSPSPIASPAPPAVTAPTTPGGAGLASAIQPNNTPNRLAGVPNGQMSATLLIYVDPNCRAYRPAAPSLERLITIARAEGVSLSTEQCYRPLTQQVVDRNAACTSGNCACAATGGTSFHGWGEAADFSDATGSVNSFTSPTYLWLVQTAARFGWNHPGWAVPNGSPCPEPWHWEWVGDGGSLHGAPIKADVATLVPTATGRGYGIVTGLGAVTEHGDAGSASSPPLPQLNRVIVGGVAQPGGDGYWLVAADGGVFAYGTAPFLGSVGTTSAIGTGPTIAGMAATPDGKGYWLVSTDGEVFAFGDAAHLTDPGAGHGYFVGIAATRSGKGLWLATSSGQVDALGDAASYASPSVNQSSDPIVAIASSPSGQGYWLASAGGQVTAEGDAPALGSIPATPALPVVAIVPTASGHGYWLVTAAGAVYAFGDAPYLGNG
jgi:hypothetical protein